MNKLIASRTFVFAISSAAILLCSAWILFAKIRTTVFHGDESGWIASAYYYTGLVSAGDLDRTKWEGRELGPWGSLNMHVGEWLIGISLKGTGKIPPNAFSSLYDFDAPLYVNLREGRVPPRETLLRARRASAWFGAMCCVLVFAIGYVSFDVWTGLLAGALLMASNLFRILATQAMTDVFYLFFLLCGCLAIVLFAKATSRKRVVWIAGICGLLAGLACSVKITGLVIVGATFLLALLHRYDFRIRMSWREWKEFAGIAGLFLCCALLTVYALNPYFWPSWKDMHTRGVAREIGAMVQEKISGKSTEGNGGYPNLRELARPLEFPRLYRRWKELMQGQQAIHEWRHNRLLTIHAMLRSKDLNPPGEFLFVGLGIWVLLWKRGTGCLSAPDGSRMVSLYYLFVNYIFILLFIQLNRPRYYLPTLAASHVIAAVGIYAALSYARRALWRLRNTENMANPRLSDSY